MGSLSPVADSAARVADRAPATLAPHTFTPAPVGATVDADLCATCGCPDGGTRHNTASARVPEARAVLVDARRRMVEAIGARRGTGLDDSVLADIDGRIARAVDLLDGLAPRPYLIAGHLPPTAGERQTALPGVA